MLQAKTCFLILYYYFNANAFPGNTIPCYVPVQLGSLASRMLKGNAPGLADNFDLHLLNR